MINELKAILLNTGFFKDNEYLTAYVSLLTNYNKCQVGYEERHHVIPVAVYKYIYKCKDRTEAAKLADNDEKNYTISLLYKDHVLAHYLLYFCSSGQLKHTMARAVVNMLKSLDVGHLDFTTFKYIPEQFVKVQQLIDKIQADPNNNFYTPDAIEFLKLYYQEMGPNFCAEHLNKSNASVREKAHNLRLTQNNHKEWLEEETEIVKQYYEQYGLAYCRAKLPNHPEGSILWLASKLGLSTSRMWTEDEEKFLIENYTKFGCKRCAEVLHKSSEAVKHKAASLKLQSARNWTDEEANILLKHYKTDGVDYCVEQLKRERCAIHAKARKLGLANNRAEGWSTNEIDFIIENYAKLGSKACAEALHGRTSSAVRNQARKLGLKVKTK